jgi:hypothetical protein
MIGLAHEIWAMCQGPRPIEDVCDDVADLISAELSKANEVGQALTKGQEPCGWLNGREGSYCYYSTDPRTVHDNSKETFPIFRSPPIQQTAEPVAWRGWDMDYSCYVFYETQQPSSDSLYLSPPNLDALIAHAKQEVIAELGKDFPDWYATQKKPLHLSDAYLAGAASVKKDAP